MAAASYTFIGVSSCSAKLERSDQAGSPPRTRAPWGGRNVGSGS
jgi:hypothetical protein